MKKGGLNMRLRVLLGLLGLFGIGQVVYGYKVTIINQAASRIYYTVYTTNLFINPYDGHVEPNETGVVETGGNCLSGIDVTIHYSSQEAGKFPKQQKEHIGFGGLCEGFTVRASESCVAGKEGAPTDCKLKLEQI